jgi:hypothetical protein
MNEYGALGKWHWQRESKVQREKPVPLPLCPPQIPYGLARDWTWPPRKQKGWWFTVSWHSLNRVSLHKVRAKSCACHKGIWGNGCVAPLILNFGVRWEWPASRPSQFNPRWRGCWYRLSRGPNERQSCLWQFAELNSTPSGTAPTAHQAVLHQHLYLWLNFLFVLLEQYYVVQWLYFEQAGSWMIQGLIPDTGTRGSFLSEVQVLGPTQTPIQWILGVTCPGVNRPGREGITSI